MAPGTGRRRRAPDGPQQPPGAQYGTPAHGTPVYGTPAHGTPVYGYGDQGTPAHGSPVYDTPAHGAPRVRGGHPEHHEPGGGWGTGQTPPQRYGDWQGSPRTPHPAPAPEATPRPEAPFIPAQRRGADEALTAPQGEEPASGPAKAGKGRTFTGIAAAAVTTVLAVVVAGQVADHPGSDTVNQSAGEAGERTADGSASRSDARPTPPRQPPRPAPPPTYEQQMARQFLIDPELTGSGDFEAVPGFAKGPGKGRKVRYRVDVEKGIGLDAKLFAEAVHKTLNDDRSWAHGGAMTFERIASGEPEFVITLASPGTTATWCAKSGLDTTVDNVSCDSAATERVMINAFRWAQGAETYGPKAMLSYRQMLINHEVGHRLGHSHVNCRTPGAPAPVMQQQTKSLDIEGIKCRPNPWVHPGS
ncbi:DUF3152 domain-containing protein [Streptomyces purpureus]|uniref:DUF3152 domain-containing protein n=1 Tax=Streptomyces purpureus TaxID=1951 RepID=UPI00035CB9FE